MAMYEYFTLDKIIIFPNLKECGDSYSVIRKLGIIKEKSNMQINDNHPIPQNLQKHLFRNSMYKLGINMLHKYIVFPGFHKQSLSILDT
jgi:hypothetical protein